jgi:S1-C subfamily serine protease
MPETADSHEPSLVLDHIVGSRRTERLPLVGDHLSIGSLRGTDIYLSADDYPAVRPLHATLTREGTSYVIAAHDDSTVRVNGQPVVAQRLKHGDAVRLGDRGPIMRFRAVGGGVVGHRSVAEVMRDCLDGARVQHDPGLARVAALLRDAPTQMLKETSPWVRRGLVAAVCVLFAAVAFLTYRTFTLERQLAEQRGYFEGLGQLAAESRASGTLTVDELQALEARIEERLTVLEARSQAGERIVREASRSVVLVMGSYGFSVSDGRLLRLVLGPGGIPLRDAAGNPRLSVEGDGPALESQFTGTAFVATEDGLLITNRHVALPWEFNPAARTAMDHGLIPVMHRLVGYLPGVARAFDVELVTASDDADLAVLRCSAITEHVPPLLLSDRDSTPGESVFLLGYPTGIRALLARSDPSFVDSLQAEGPFDFWRTADRLSSAGHVAPLATRGIVGQVTRSSIVYDAETTHGGSGGPVLDLTGRVQAINAAVLTDFAGSNIGVPAAQARALLNSIQQREP